MYKQNKISIIYSTALRRRMAVRRKPTGFGLVEATTSAIFIVVAVIVSLDCWFMIMAARINDTACRDAARAAAQAGDSQADATNAASAAAAAYSQMGSAFMVAPPTISIVAYNNTTQSQMTAGGAVSPPLSVIVQSTCTVKTLIPVSFFSDSANSVTFTDQKTYPIIPSTTGVQANNITQ